MDRIRNPEWLCTLEEKTPKYEYLQNAETGKEKDSDWGFLLPKTLSLLRSVGRQPERPKQWATYLFVRL